MSAMLPLVSVIIPTTLDRREFNEQIIKDYRAQDYLNKEVMFDYGHGNIGTKRNRLCTASRGEIILHMDSDDQYKPDWISKQVKVLVESGADIVGLSEFQMYNRAKDEAWRYVYAGAGVDFVTGATLCYWKRYWEGHNFWDIQVGEDVNFVYGRRIASDIPKIVGHDYIEGFLCSMHEGNTSTRDVGDVRYKKCGEEELRRIKNIWNLA